MHDTNRTGNLLGATALAVNERALATVASAAGTSTSGAAALVVLSESPDGLGVSELGRRIGLSQPAAARMVDSLQAADLVWRQRSSGREVRVTPTAGGQEVASRLLAARGQSLRDLVSILDPDEQDVLADLLAKLLAHLYAEVGSSELLCRLCDRAGCITDAPCPVGQAERDRGR